MLDWARTEMEGTIRLALRISPLGDTYQMQIEQSTGSGELDAAAVEAAKSWRFKPASWQGRAVDSNVTVELTFRFFEYSVSRIDDPELAKVPRRSTKTAAHPDRSEGVRRLVAQLRPPWLPAIRDWGPGAAVQDLGTIRGPEWRRYNIKSNFLTAGHACSVVVRWELYRVAHDSHATLWEVAVDRTGAVWAAKAESLDTLERTIGSTMICPGANTSTK